MVGTMNGQKIWAGQYSLTTPVEMDIPVASMIDIFEQTVAKTPDAPAVFYFNQVISFRELDDSASRLATKLMDWGIGHGDRVGIYLQNDPEFLAAQYAIWKRGAIVVPLNPMFKEQELRYYLNDAGIKVIVLLDSLYSNKVKQVISDCNVQHVIVVREFGFFGEKASLPLSDGAVYFSDITESVYPEAKAREKVNPDDIAYLVYTSGTTGKPRGAMNSHRNITFNAEVYRIWMDMDASDTILAIAPLFHVTGIVGHTALSALVGAPLVLFHRFDPKTVLEAIRKHHPTMTVGSITAFISLLNHPDSAITDFSSIKKCFSGGAPIPSSVVEQFEEKTGIYIHNIYGLTETNSPTHAVPLGKRAPVDADSGALAIGVPIPNCDAIVIDLEDASKEVEIGKIGELAVKGPMLTRGYWNKPEETKRAFQSGYFLTGDVVRQDKGGWFYVVDRKKDMINTSGFKVWPRDVEDVLYQHPAVKEAAVIGVPDEYRGETVKAFISLKEQYIGQVTQEDVIVFCKERMAAYKYPRIVEIIPEVPKTATGKFLRRTLREM
jgi:long-chain acyl-CoA synthetase